MHYLKRMTGKKGEDAVSPVVGVMLMLVVTLIIAAGGFRVCGGAGLRYEEVSLTDNGCDHYKQRGLCEQPVQCKGTLG